MLLGIVDMAGAPLTMTLRSGSGTVKSTQIFSPSYTNYTTCFTTTVQSGDQISLQSAATTEVFTVPLLTARHNYARQAVEGSAPPQGALFTEFKSLYGGVRRVFADGNGQYGVDTSDMHLPLKTIGRTYLYDDAGNMTSAYFTITGYQAFLPVIRRQ